MSNIPQEYLSGHDFGFSAVDEMPTQQQAPQPVQEDVEGINDNIMRIENKVDAITSSIKSLTTKLTSLDDEFDNVRVTTELEVKDKLVQVEKMIMPLLVNLLKNADKDYIHWPNRAPKIQEQIDKLLAVTRET